MNIKGQNGFIAATLTAGLGLIFASGAAGAVTSGRVFNQNASRRRSDIGTGCRSTSGPHGVPSITAPAASSGSAASTTPGSGSWVASA